ncbi:unnamed protein product [Lactuca virosa]|uniref:Apple domain-containing protein n=1 Tax=Lactuca virosa TaxID=75947 RepID=A0AAU9PEW9_9ASTR|nr:unnamed protein product [Lactuca virosa]
MGKWTGMGCGSLASSAVVNDVYNFTEFDQQICYMLHMYDHYIAATILNYLASRMGPSSSSSSSSSQFHLGVFPQILGFLFFFLSIGASGTTFTFVNDCGFTIWPGVNGWTDSNTGFELTKGTACSFQAPVGWSCGIWGRTGCSFNVSGYGSTHIFTCIDADYTVRFCPASDSFSTIKLGRVLIIQEPIEEASQRLMIRRRGQPYWTSGSLNNQIFQYMFSLNGPSSQSRYNLSSIYTNEARYFSYEANNISALPMWILTAKRQVTDIDNSTVWTPEFCYGYDSGNGCVELSLPRCRRESDKFSEMKGDFANDLTRSAIDDNSSLSISDCFVKCWNDCTCVGFNSSSINGTGCVIWTGSNNFLVNPRDNSTLKYVINQNPINPSTGTKIEKSKNWEWILIGVVIPLFFLCFGILCFKDIHQLLKAATDDFSVENKRGQGGFGPVYKGRLSDGREIAIKRLSRTSGQGIVEFKNELMKTKKQSWIGVNDST